VVEQRALALLDGGERLDRGGVQADVESVDLAQFLVLLGVPLVVLQVVMAALDADLG
jgi:hypothetical protein